MKYPAILKLNNGCLVLATSLGCGFALQDYKDEYESNYVNKFYKDFHGFESATNKTSEYLANTYGEVVSTEHVRFILELAKNAKCAGVDICEAKLPTYNATGMFFNFYIASGVLRVSFSELEMARNRGEKQITIPPPPKADSKKWNPDFYDIGEPPKHFDCVCNKCGGKCCTGQCEDFPKVGDEILTASKSKAKVRGKHEGRLWIEYINGGKGFDTINAATIQKPKTPEEELRDEVAKAVCKANDLWTSTKEAQQVSVQEFVATKIMGEYNITKKPQ